MALQRFWSAIQNARSFFFGRMNEAVDHGRRTDTASLMDAVTQTADVWLRPDLVKEYDPSDFAFLSDEEQTKLREAVEGFRQLTSELQATGPSREQIERGYDLFATINNLLAPHFGEEVDLRRIAEATRSIHWPKYVMGLDCRVGNDSTGSPAAWIRFIVNDDLEIESPAVQSELAQMRGVFRKAIEQAGISRWPYITVRTKSELKELLG
jgi:hypothetical protein